MSASDKPRVPVAVHSSPTAPPLSKGFPHEIQLWFQRPGDKAYVLCLDGWKEWTKGTAIKDVCSSKQPSGDKHDES